jgi:hypothetical protein
MAHENLLSYQIKRGESFSARPLKNVQFCSRSRKAKISTAGIYQDISRIDPFY